MNVVGLEGISIDNNDQENASNNNKNVLNFYENKRKNKVMDKDRVIVEKSNLVSNSNINNLSPFNNKKTSLPFEVFCFGNTIDGQCGFGGIEEPQIFVPTIIKNLSNKRVQFISTGVNHTLFVLDDGTLMSCGNNDNHQLGHDKSRKKPERIDALETQTIEQAACGLYHSVALTSQGLVFTWGSNKEGQLGSGKEENFSTPKMIKWFPNNSIQIVMVASGYNHVVALSDVCKVYTWGNNEDFQLGLGPSVEEKFVAKEPRLIDPLVGLPIASIFSGAHHCFALTISGVLFGWGNNRNGQLGLGDTISRPVGTLVKSLRNHKVAYVTCGEFHSVILTKNGGVFTCGLGSYGQLGHSSAVSEYIAKKVFDFMGSEVSMVASGRNHTVAYIPAKNQLYTFGLGGNGQLGTKEKRTITSPNPITMPTKALINKFMLKKNNNKSYAACQIYAGGDQTFVVMDIVTIGSSQQRDLRSSLKSLPIKKITRQLIDKIQTIKKMNDSFVKEIEKIFSSLSCLNASFLFSDLDVPCDEFVHCVDIKLSQSLFDFIDKLSFKPVKNLIEGLIEKQLIPSAIASSISLSPTKTPLPTSFVVDFEALRWLVTIPSTYLFKKPDSYFGSIIFPVSKYIIQLSNQFKQILENWWFYSGNVFQLSLLKMYKSVLFQILNLKAPANDNNLKRHQMFVCLEMMNIINNINKRNTIKIDHTHFYIENLASMVSMEVDFLYWDSLIFLQHDQIFKNELIKLPLDFQSNLKPFCGYPFILDGHAKSTILHIDSIVQMRGAMQMAQSRNILSFFTPISPIDSFLVLMVTRENLVRETLNQLSRYDSSDFKKPLKVVFVGEEAMDAGGVQKEFFLLLMKDLMDPKYGMFSYYEESRLSWFNPDSFELSDMFELIGLLCGLAIYNSVIIPMPMPLALFKKLLDFPVNLDDLKEIQPTVGKNLTSLLNYIKDDVEDVFYLNFEVTRSSYGKLITIPLVPGGNKISVTKHNKKEYVDEYINYFFNTSCQSSYKAFNNGFKKVSGGKILRLFHPVELQSMVVGNENYDWADLEKNTEYKSYKKTDKTIQYFWQVFKELSEEKKKKFLLFLTGCDRVPIGGMKQIKIIIQPMGTNENLLPVAHTCFNILDLPKYQSKEILRKKLLQAIEHTQGFGIV